MVALFSIVMACNVQSSTREVYDALKKYLSSSGMSHNLRSVYGVDLPPDGFGSFYIYPSIVSGDLSFSPLVYFDDKAKETTGDSYTRCNVLVFFKGNVLIAQRNFSTDDAKNSTPCSGFEKKTSIVKSRTGSWIILNAVYQGMSNYPEIIPEAFFFDGKKLCYSEKVSLDFEYGEISIENIKDGFNNYDGCSS